MAAVPPVDDDNGRSDLIRSMVPSVRHLAPQALIAGVLPIIAYSLLRPHVSSDTVALAAVMVFPLAELAYERRRRGRFEPVGIIALIGIAIGLFGAIALHGSDLLLKVRDSALTGVFGVVCLVTLGLRRPAMYFLARAFSAQGDAAKTAEFDGIWELPGVPRRFRIVTTVWGVALVAEAVLRISLALLIPTQMFLVVAQVVSWSVIGGLLWFTVLYSRAGERAVAGAANADRPGMSAR
jgi:hypothetical protein